MKVPIICVLHEEEKGFKYIGECLICSAPVYISLRGIPGEITIAEIERLPVTPRYVGRECMIDMCLVFMQLMKQSPELRDIAKKKLLEEDFGMKL